jgi:hypothetical protein
VAFVEVQELLKALVIVKETFSTNVAFVAETVLLVLMPQDVWMETHVTTTTQQLRRMDLVSIAEMGVYMMNNQSTL